MRELYIAGRRIADDERAYVIVDIGHNHGGDLGKAKEMVDTAIENGADAVKFQTRHPELVYSPQMYDWKWESPHAMAETYGKHREALEFSQEEWESLFAYCEGKVIALSTPFDEASADQLNEIGMPVFKIASGDATNIPLIEHVAGFGKPMIISTGGCSTEDVDRIYEAMHPAHGTGHPRFKYAADTSSDVPFALLQCSCIYPCPPEVQNIKVIEEYRSRYPNTVTGLSTHNPNIYTTLGAFALGGRIFEHHYTNDRDWIGTDNHFSLTPPMLKELRTGLDELHVALGDGEKRCHPEEASYTEERRKSLHWAEWIPEGTVVEPKHMVAMCPGGGIPPYDIDKIVGKRINYGHVGVGKGERVSWTDLMVTSKEAVNA